MWGCCRLAVVLISARNRSAPITAASSGLRTLMRDLAVVLEVLREVDGRHAARAELALDAVAVGEGGGQPLGGQSGASGSGRRSEGMLQGRVAGLPTLGNGRHLLPGSRSEFDFNPMGRHDM